MSITWLIVSITRTVQFLLAAESTKFISVMSFGKELYKRRERSESRSFRFKRQLPSSVSLSQRSPGNRKVFRIGLHATASKSSPRKALFSSVQEQTVNINQKIIFLRDI